MKNLLVKRWFLLALFGGVGLALLRPDWLRPWIKSLPPHAVVATALFLMAWGLESRSLFRTMVRPLPALWAVLISYGVLPALAWLAGGLLPGPDDFRVGLMISASVPCTLASAVLWTRMAGGQEATALLVTLLTTWTSWLITTAWLTLGTGTQAAPHTAGMMQGLVLFLVVPVALGQISRAVGPLARTVTRHKHVLSIVSQLLVLTIVLQTAVEVRDELGKRETSAAAGLFLFAGGTCVATHLAALLCGYWSSKGLGFDRPNQIAVAFACSQKTLPVALVLFKDYFKEAYPLALVPIFCYHFGQFIVDTFIADGLVRNSPQRHKEHKEEKEPQTDDQQPEPFSSDLPL